MSERVQSSPDVRTAPNVGESISSTPLRTITVSPETAPTPQTAVVVEEEEPEQDDAQRRRRRRRRRRSLKSDGPEKKIRLFLFALVIVLLVIAVSGAQIGSWLKAVVAQIKPILRETGITTMLKSFKIWEVLALIVAALILVYLSPGMEDKVLRYLGIKKERRRR